MPENKVYITPLEVAILRVFWDHLYMTDEEIAKELEVLASKLRK